MPKPRFVADSMLGALARWLRLLGYDTLYARDWPDGKILEEAERGDRIIVTRDRGLYRRALRRGARAVLVSDDLPRALAKLSVAAGVKLEADPDDSRCPLCNSPLRRASKSEVRGRVPPEVLEAYSEFWLCSGCGQVYWRGTHWRTIERTLAEARKLAGEMRR
jgi:hypothetical protein